MEVTLTDIVERLRHAHTVCMRDYCPQGIAIMRGGL
jgi:hypothetical protein